MKAIHLALAIVSAAILATSGVQVSGDSSRSDGVSAEEYCEIVDSLIATCEKKCALKESRSPNVREGVALSLMKADFYRNNKEKLVGEMMRYSVTPRAGQVQHFMDRRFFEAASHRESQIAEGYSAPAY